LTAAAWAVGMAGVGWVSDARAAHVRGAVVGYQHLLNPVWEEAKDTERHLFSFREPVPTVRAEFRRLYPHIPKELCLALLSTERTTPQKPVLVRVGGGRTTPVTIVVAPGTQLQFQNSDPFAHRLYAVGNATFPASDTVKGGVRSLTAPASGSIEIRDEAAPSLRMWVITEPNVAAVAYPSLKGDFALSADTPGDYRLQAYFAGKKVGPEVPVKVGTADIDLSKAPLKVADESKAEKAEKAADKSN
jgi:hypothetical protein